MLWINKAWISIYIYIYHLNGLVQERYNSIANALELQFFLLSVCIVSPFAEKKQYMI